MKTSTPLQLYTANTPNGQKISIALEELGLAYGQTDIDLSKGEQKTPQFLRLNPNGKIPVLVDQDRDLVLFESAVILSYLAERQGMLAGDTADQRRIVQQWLCFQIASVGPMLGQLWWFRHGSTSHNREALERYTGEALRLYGVVERQLAERPFIAGDAYSIADIALFTWLRTHEELALDLQPFPEVRDWLEQIAGRVAVRRGLARAAGLL
ncbi:glutathione S-transferase family protein [Pseudomonas xantholysinigenes]|uniref:Glutathione S-transferase N-terminal domain-containing protein n=1 Tax=Pseudomonas xantholysinigenes TaxID=2745490 RepID=A0A9E6PSE5_9PSED|nr:glutathione S-transferase N-terminal domain-containing protein [Pseudomonas xantholysinigenes]QXI36435.1 glutathione S-transferase N-terminal domain-containing protein [Pseudomonas xantholysinigenes]